MKLYKTLLNAVSALAAGCLLISCEKFLDVKPDKSLAVPATAKDLQAMLDFETRMNTNYPVAGDIAGDDYYLKPADWSTLMLVDDRNAYTWEKTAVPGQDWQFTYSRVFPANVVLDLVDDVFEGVPNRDDYNAIKGTALFFRGYSYFLAAEVFTMPYQGTTAPSRLGLPLRLTSDVNDKTVRPTQQETYDQIIKDLTEASRLLPVVTAFKTRPGRAAAFAALTRVCLVRGDYAKAGAYADSSLLLNNELIDYNTVNAAMANPFQIFNSEVLLHALGRSNTGVFSPSRARVDTILYASYHANDLRKAIYFKKNADNSFQFKGSYGGSNSGALFAGLATDEMYLTKAECLARLGKGQEAMEVLNSLLKKRWKAATFTGLTAASDQEALDIILRERRKELLFRGSIRWMDLRRLNHDPAFARTLTRRMDQEQFILPPNDKRYAFLIPWSVVEEAGIQQNER